MTQHPLTALLRITAAATLVTCGVPAVSFAGSNATVKAQEETDAAIQECIDGLAQLEAGEDYDDECIVVRYSGSETPQTVELQEDESVEDALEDAANDDMVVAAQPNYYYTLQDTDSSVSAGSDTTDECAVNDTLASKQYYLESYDGDSSQSGASVKGAWQYAKSNQTTTVAVLDTGVETSHKDLKDNIDTTHMATVTSYGSVVVGSMEDVNGHGTHVAGIIAATSNNGTGVSGVSYNARVLPINVFSKVKDRSGAITTVSSTLQSVAALEYLDSLIEGGRVSNLHVVNMSFGGYALDNGGDTLLHNEIKHLRSSHNVLCVCAGGNGDGSLASINACYPADWDECVSVTALNESGQNCAWSDFNQYKDISAPGVDMLSTYSNSAAKADSSVLEGSYKKNESYAYLSGTSMAAPLVSGVFALMWAANPALTADDAVSTVKSTARWVKGNEGDDARRNIVQNGSAGAIDAAAAVAATLGISYSSTAATQANTASKPPKVKITKKIAKKRAFVIYWNKKKTVKGVSGFQVRIKKKGAKKWKKQTLKDALAVGARESKLKRRTKYCVQVRAYYLKSSGKKIYGAWSAKKVVKTK